MTSPSQTALRLRLSETKESKEFRDSVPRLPARGRVSFGDSPIQRSRSVPKGVFLASQENMLQVRSAGNATSTSLAKLQMERWSLLEQVKGLESQVATRDMLIDENNKLRDELNEVETELARVRGKYKDMADKLSEYLTKEKTDRKSMESQILVSKRQMDAVTQENSRLESEVSNLRDELSRIKLSLISSMDRGVHERQMSDIQNENAHLRTLLEETVPKSMLVRLETDLTEKLANATNNNIHLRELQLTNTRLNTEIDELSQQHCRKTEQVRELEESVESHRDQLAQLKAEAVQIIDEKDLELQKFKATAEKEICLIQSELESTKDTVTTLENKLKKKALDLIEARNELKFSMELLSQVKPVMGRSVRLLREELEQLRNTIAQEKRSLFQSFSGQLDALANKQDNYYKNVLREITSILMECVPLEGLPKIDSARSGTGKLLDTIATVKEYLLDTRDENKVHKIQITQCMSENEILISKIREKDKLIDGLIVRMSRQEQERRRESAAVMKLRNSIKAAEDSLSNGKVQHEKALSESMMLSNNQDSGTYPVH